MFQDLPPPNVLPGGSNLTLTGPSMRFEVPPVPILVESDTDGHAGNEPEHVDDHDEVLHILEPKKGSKRAVLEGNI
jgi:hypothetical protein